VEHVTRTRREMRTKYWSENLNETKNLEDLSADGRITLQCILEK